MRARRLPADELADVRDAAGHLIDPARYYFRTTTVV